MPIPRTVHFVFGLAPRNEPFHLVHYLAIESCRQVLAPERVFMHYKHLPYGVHWDAIRPKLTLLPADEAPEVLAADYGVDGISEAYRYAHHADFVRLDALIEHGGVYADIDTLFIRPIPDELYDESFVIGEEDPVPDEVTGTLRPSLCNALLMSTPGSTFARTWRARMGAALDGSWSNHSGLLAHSLVAELPESVRVVPAEAFYPASWTVDGIRSLFERTDLDTSQSCSVHLWGHLWWDARRHDFTRFHAGLLTAEYIRSVDTSYNLLARPFLPDFDLWTG